MSVKKIAAMPGSGPGPKARVKNSAQISMSTERRKSKNRFVTRLTTRLRVMLRAAMKDSGKASRVANSVPTKAMTMVCSSFGQTSPCCHSALFRMLSRQARVGHAGSMRVAA